MKEKKSKLDSLIEACGENFRRLDPIEDYWIARGGKKHDRWIVSFIGKTPEESIERLLEHVNLQ